MEIQTKPIFRSATPRVKCIVGHPNYPDVFVCLYTGEIQIFDPRTLKVKKSQSICNVPIRAAVIVPSKDWILIGNDEGKILIVDLGNLSVIDTINAHDDFIRKIIVDEVNQRIVTVSDDNRTKLWSFSNGITLINKYKDSKHFVMDVAFFPNDPSHFLTASLDKKIRMYSILNTKLVKVFKGHMSGVNSLTFINQENFVSGSDDCSLLVWDVRKTVPITTLKGHTKNVNSVKALKNGFASCSEDNSVRIWSRDLKLVEVLNLQGRVWDLYMKDNKIFVGSDEELCVFEEISSLIVATLSENKIFYNTGNVLNSVKYDEIGAFKELGSLGEDFETFKISQNGKLIGVMGNGKITVYSPLGMRKKYSDSGKDIFFISSDSFIYLKDEELIIFSKNDVEKKYKLDGVTRILYCDSRYVIVNIEGDDQKCCIFTYHDPSTPIFNYSDSLTLISEIDSVFEKAIMINDNLILINDKINIFNSDFKRIEVLDHNIESFCVDGEVMYFSTLNRSFYLIVNDDKAYVFSMKFHSHLIGVRDNLIIYYSSGIKTDSIDIDFINFKVNFFKGIEEKPDERFKEKAILFFELLGLHEKALSLASDENQKFEILIKLGKLEDALEIANSPIKFEKLGFKFLINGNLSKAADCFYKSNNLNNLFLIDVFGDKKYLDFVAKVSKDSGRLNLALLASYKAQDFETCKLLLKNTPYEEAFTKFYR